MAVSLSKMMLLICFSIFTSLPLFALVGSAQFDELYHPSWGFDHFAFEGDILRLKLDKFTGAGFSSKSKYMFGKVTIQMKLVEGDSAGTVTAFYMSSDGPNRHEFDLEFLGNTSGEPYLVQTNVYVNGVGNREQRLSLWFDPTVAFHSYSILWNPHHVVFLVDDTPIRLHANMERRGLAFPRDQPMGVHGSLWNADDWATQGGRVKTEWAHAPFIVSYKGFQISGCECPASIAAADNIKRCTTSSGEPTLSELTAHQKHQLLWVKANHMVYNYCTDSARFPVAPEECEHHRHPAHSK